jgi:uncharacterized protein (TIGR00255 family)
MRSMTGYGRATRELDGRELAIELKSVNHRFLDLSFRMPRSFLFLEDDARKLISSRVSRGHVEVYITYKNRRSDAKVVELDKALFCAYQRALDAVEGLPDDRTPISVNKCLVLDKENSYLLIFNSTIKAITIRRAITQEDQKALFIHRFVGMLLGSR